MLIWKPFFFLNFSLLSLTKPVKFDEKMARNETECLGKFAKVSFGGKAKFKTFFFTPSL